MDAGFSVGGWRSFEENERGSVSPHINGGLEGLLVRPSLQQIGFQLNGVQFTCRFGWSHASSTGGAVLNLTQFFVHFPQTCVFARLERNR
jgi:hypothetical protein